MIRFKINIGRHSYTNNSINPSAYLVKVYLNYWREYIKMSFSKCFVDKCTSLRSVIKLYNTCIKLTIISLTFFQKELQDITKITYHSFTIELMSLEPGNGM